MEEPEYYRVLREKTDTPDATPFEIERSILAAWKREWSENPDASPYYHIDTYDFHPNLEPVKVSGWAQHMLRYQQLVMPNVEINPWIVKMWCDLDRCIFTHKRKIANFIGSKNSGKTNFFAIASLLIMSIDPDFTRIFISGPYKTAADATVWGRIETRLNNMKAADSFWDSVEFVTSRGRAVFSESSGESGYIELITLDKVGKLQGTKSLHPGRGWLVLICDEIAEFPSRALLDALDNLTGNDNFICLTGCNFKNIEGMEGDLCRPDGREYAELHPEIDQEWLSNYKSVTFRYDGHLSPNILAGEIISPFLLKEGTRKDMEDIHGINGPKYLEQVRSFPNSSLSDFFVTTRDKVRAGGGYDEFVWEGIEPTLCAFCDPGFGGDPCKIGAFRFGVARMPMADGTFGSGPVFEPISPLETIKIDTKLTADENWIKRLREITSGKLAINPGSLVTPEQQIAVASHEFLSKMNIPVGNFGYDGSMRASIVHEMITVLGTSIHSIDFGGKPTDRVINQSGVTADAEYYNFVSELYFNFAAVVQSGQLRGAEKIQAAIFQIVRRPWALVGKKKQIQPKDKYKLNNQGRSPDDADTVVGGLEMAIRLGFRSFPRRRVESPEESNQELINKLMELNLFKRPSSKPIRPL